jgi:hypothetical protein
MIKFLIELKKLVLGTNSKQAFKRVIILIITIGVFTTLILNVGCGIKDGQFFFEWKPADVSIKKEV